MRYVRQRGIEKESKLDAILWFSFKMHAINSNVLSREEPQIWL